VVWPWFYGPIRPFGRRSHPSRRCLSRPSLCDASRPTSLAASDRTANRPDRPPPRSPSRWPFSPIPACLGAQAPELGPMQSAGPTSNWPGVQARPMGAVLHNPTIRNLQSNLCQPDRKRKVLNHGGAGTIRRSQEGSERQIGFGETKPPLGKTCSSGRINQDRAKQGEAPESIACLVPTDPPTNPSTINQQSNEESIPAPLDIRTRPAITSSSPSQPTKQPQLLRPFQRPRSALPSARRCVSSRSVSSRRAAPSHGVWEGSRRLEQSMGRHRQHANDSTPICSSTADGVDDA
jgi:hypothetical protein